ncbi:MAG: hypothetical protein HXS50_04280, partial [Theionarchaea archaeon]|nr:hypothetical protein [Theionarchaea archaeon]
KKLAPHSLVVDCTGYVGPKGLDTPLGHRRTDFYVSLFAGRKDVLDETPPLTDGLLPLILHEYHWWSCYPDPSARRKYEKTQIIPFWLDSLERTARVNGQEHLIETYRRNSLWLQALCRKDGIEYVRRKPNTEGYILWLLIDLGLWSEGLFDDFWRPKNVSAEEFLRSNGDTVVVLGSGNRESLEVGKRDRVRFKVDRYGSSILEGGSILGSEGNRCFAAGRYVSIPIAVDHYGSSTLERGKVKWWIDDAPLSLSGTLGVPSLEPGNMASIGTVDISLPVAGEPYKFKLGVELSQEGRRVNSNEWSFWAFPETEPSLEEICGNAMIRVGTRRENKIAPGTEIVLCDDVDDQLADFVVDGGRCILFTGGTAIENPIGADNPGDPYKMFRTIPWNAGDHGNSGTVIAAHPLLKSFPHEGMCDLQFLYMLKGHQPMDFGPLIEHGIEPIIRMIDHYAANRNVAHMIEFSVGKGAVLATSLGILDNIPGRIEAGYLLKCLVEYAGGEEFGPAARITRELFGKLFSRPA